MATIGIEFLSKAIEIDGKSIKLHFFDTAGEDKYQAIIQTYLKAKIFCF